VAVSEAATVAQLGEFDETIDARSPSEFAADRVPGAINCPALNDEERARVGTLYKQVSSFDARRVGAALVARNIAHHVETTLADRPRDWRPLVYCWRGGGRSAALVEVLRRIGWRAARLEGGYRAYRHAVRDELERLPGEFEFRVVCGRTGSGKSRLLAALASEGAQVLDLEGLACHRGSVLGAVPDRPQPSQKLFESLAWSALKGFDRDRPVFVESESRKVGDVQVPGVLLGAIRVSRCVVLEASVQTRVQLLCEEYGHFLVDATTLCERLEALTAHYGRETIASWQALARAGRNETLVAELLGRHYDPAYDRSIRRNFPQLADAPVFELADAGESAMRSVARAVLATRSETMPV